MFAVIFEVKPAAARWDDYLAHAAILRPEVQAIDGFLSNERFAGRSRPGWLVSLSFWRDEKALIRWRTHALHHEFQCKGRLGILADYHLRVGEVVADSDGSGTLAQWRFDTTEAGVDTMLTLLERPADAETEFESITRPGHGLLIRRHCDDGAGHRRIVRVIRDYGMTDRREAPQYFPAIAG